MISCEVANAGKYDLIIPFGWWHQEHPLLNIKDPKKWTFDEKKCYDHIEDEAVADMFKWDETVVYDEEAKYVGWIGREEDGVKLEVLPKPNWQYQDLFED